MSNINVKSHVEWWDNLSSVDQIQIQIDNGIFGHDEGICESEIEQFYKEFIRTNKAHIRKCAIESILD